MGVKAWIGSLILVPVGKNPVITFKRIVIQVDYENTRLLHLPVTLLLGHVYMKTIIFVLITIVVMVAFLAHAEWLEP